MRSILAEQQKNCCRAKYPIMKTGACATKKCLILQEDTNVEQKSSNAIIAGYAGGTDVFLRAEFDWLLGGAGIWACAAYLPPNHAPELMEVAKLRACDNLRRAVRNLMSFLRAGRYDISKQQRN